MFRRGAIVHDRAVRVEAGDGAEAGADEVGTARTRGRDPLVDVDFVQRCAMRVGERRLEPCEEFAQGGAILFHRVAHVVHLGIELARLGQRRRVDGFHHAHVRRHGGAHAGRDAARVDQQRAVGRQRGQGLLRLAVRRHAHAILLQARTQVPLDLAVGDEQGRPRGLHERVREEHGIEADVRAAQVEQVGDVVERREEVTFAAQLRHRVARRVQFIGAIEHGVRRLVFVDRFQRQAGAVAPDLVQQVEVRAELDAARGERIAQQARDGQAEHARVDGDGLSLVQVVRQPVDVQQARAGRDLHQPDLRAGQFLLRLCVVAAIRPDAGEVARGDEGADGAREAGQPLAAFPTAGQVFGQVRIGGRHNEGVDLVARHRGAQPGKALGARVGGVGCWHGSKSMFGLSNRYDTPSAPVQRTRPPPPFDPNRARKQSDG